MKNALLDDNSQRLATPGNKVLRKDKDGARWKWKKGVDGGGVILCFISFSATTYSSFKFWSSPPLSGLNDSSESVQNKLRYRNKKGQSIQISARTNSNTEIYRIKW